MRNLIRRILAASEPLGDKDALRQLAREAVDSQADALVILGTLVIKGESATTYPQLFKAVAEANIPTFCIPGPYDAPLHEYLRQAASIEMGIPMLRNVHETFAMTRGHVVFAGVGGMVDDDTYSLPEERTMIRYPGWLVEYRMKWLAEFPDHPKVLMFTTAPEHRGFRDRGSAAVAEIIKTYNPRLVIVSGKEPRCENLGRSMVVVPGHLCDGQFCLINFAEASAEFRNLKALAR